MCLQCIAKMAIIAKNSCKDRVFSAKMAAIDFFFLLLRYFLGG